MGMGVAQPFERIETSSLVTMCCFKSPEPVEIEKLQIALIFFDSHRTQPPTSCVLYACVHTYMTYIFIYESFSESVSELTHPEVPIYCFEL